MSTEDRSYAECETQASTIRDRLAAQRTTLANERTLLAYARTTLTLLIAGVTFLHFFPHIAAQVLGWTFLPAAAVTAAIGISSHVKIRRSISSLERIGPAAGCPSPGRVRPPGRYRNSCEAD